MNLTGKFKIKAIKKKTQAIFFKGLKVGDEFELSYNLNGGYNNAPWVEIIQDGKVVHGNDGLQLRKNLDKFELEQVVDIPPELKEYENIIHYIANIDTIFLLPNGELREWNDKEVLEEIEKMVVPIWNNHCEKIRKEGKYAVQEPRPYRY